MHLSEATFQRIAVWMKQQTGVYFADSKKPLVLQRLGRRVRARSQPSFESYLRLLQQDEEAQERAAAIDLLTTHETYFFREAKHFAWLEQWLRSQPAGGMRVWSAACASGEEAWSIAMQLAAVYGVRGDWQVLGSDISLQALEQAQRGHYTLQRCEHLPAGFLQRYCLKGVRQYEGTLLIGDELRPHVSFQQINLDRELPGLGLFPLVFMRNVLIYFDAETKRKVVSRVLGQLLPGGYLLVSHAESLHGLGLPLQLEAPGIYRKLP